MGQQEQFMPERDDAPVTAAKDLDSDRALLAEAVTINRDPDDVYAFWRDPTNLVQVMENVAAIERIDDRRSRWTVKGPGGKDVCWVSVITHDVPGEELTWQSEEGAQVANSGKVEFRDAGPRGTVVRAVIAYDPPGGAIGQLIAKLFQREPRIQTRRDLHRLKQFLETGELATSARNRRIHEERYGDESQAEKQA
ncbi:SRPBCC family protein [Novosphingobium huizhouense]|uniref:SRPBCC family protein n=1 Tax=Novosphingobium huizhouense TaxID=2866625 RepID=UPI001CD88795|nr:SRPBCC family protein [Novosphingobium huizhouense]